jgi:hypothetical protein
VQIKNNNIMSLKKTKPVNTRANKIHDEQMKIQQAQELLQRNRLSREQAFHQELMQLCQKYQVELIPSINIQAK